MTGELDHECDAQASALRDSYLALNHGESDVALLAACQQLILLSLELERAT
jgi:hypothetical protein